ncbi:class I adenylate-forming enzyme family protein [Streptomyces synnematoformans]
MPTRRPPMNIGALFDWHAGLKRQTAAWLDRPFDIAPAGGVHYDAEALAALVRDFAGRLYAAGARPGDRVAIIKENHLDITLAAASAARIGALPATIAGVGAPEAHRKMIERLDPSVVVVSPAVLARADAAGVKLGGPEIRFLVLGEPGPGAPEGALTLGDLEGAPEAPVQLRGPDEPMLIMHTSGTTGVPKLVVHSGTSLLGGAAKLERIRFPLLASNRSTVYASSISFAHGRTVTWLMGQFTLAPEKLVAISRHDPDNAARVLAEHRPTTLEACPNIFQRWESLAHRRPELFHRVRMYVGTFDAVHPRTVRTFLGVSRRRLPLWGQSWGQSEAGPICAAVYTRRMLRRTTDAKAVTSLIGRPMPGFAKVRVVDVETGEPVRRRGEPGMMLVASSGRCLDYLGESDRYREKATGRWWNTGDIGERTKGGQFKLIDREVDVIPGMSGIELESILLDRLPDVSDVTVLGTPGEKPVPVLSLDGDELDPQAWQRATADLPELGEPRVIPWEDVPRTATWKVRRLELREKVLGSTGTIGTGRWT